MEGKDLKQISNLLDEKFEQNNKNLATKDYLDEKFEENNKKLKEEIVDEIGQITNIAFSEHKEAASGRIEKFAKQITGQILHSEDKIIKKLNNIEDDQTANIGAHDRMGKKLDNHESRIKKLELRATA